MVGPSRASGDHWENVALRFLESRGLVTLHRNFTCRLGEIDMVMRDGPEIVFVEVRYRRGVRFGSGADTVTWRKQQRLGAAARRYLMFNPGLWNARCRFDVLSIGRENGRLLINWIRNAFDL